MKRILIIGMGSLGQAIHRARWSSRYLLECATRSGHLSHYRLDIAQRVKLEDFFKHHHRYVAVFNCAAMTDVDQCEKKPEDARKTNALAVKYLAEACARYRIPFVHFSTNYVFSGNGKTRLSEKDDVAPCSVYGATKCEGEYYALTLPRWSVVIRTSWIFGGQKSDFVNHFLKKLDSLQTVPVVSDQIACVTYVSDLAEAVGRVVEKKLFPAVKRRTRFNKIYHLTNDGALTRYDLLIQMRHILKKRNKILKVPQKGFQGWQAVRPRYSVLSNREYEAAFNGKLRHWTEAIQEYLNKDS